MKNKKSQLTIFIIIGLLIIITSIFVINFEKVQILLNPNLEIENNIKNNIETCMENKLKNGVGAIFSKGGWIELDENIESNEKNYLELSSKIPVWDRYRIKGIPSINSMKSELINYLNVELPICIKEKIEELEKEYTLNYEENVEIRELEINKDSIYLEISYPITYQKIKDEKMIGLDTFTYKQKKVNLKESFELAREIYDFSQETRFLEVLTMEQLRSLNDYEDTTKSFPTEGMILSCVKKYWNIETLKENLEKTLNNNFRYIQFEKTIETQNELLNNEEVEEFKKYYNSLYRYSPLSKNYKNFKVEIVMPSYNIVKDNQLKKKLPIDVFSVKPNSGGLTYTKDKKIDIMEDELPFSVEVPVPCIQIIHHFYDIEFKVLVRITDERNELYETTFQFPINVKIEQNFPKEILRKNIEQEITSDVINDNFCNEQRIYPTKIVVEDIFNNRIEEVSLRYRCANYFCEIGKTEKNLNTFSRKPELIANLSYCNNGQLIATKEGYLEEKKRLKVDESFLSKTTFIGENYQTIILTKLNEINLKKDNIKLLGKLNRKLKENESVIITLKNNEKNFVSTGYYPSQEQKLKIIEDTNLKYNVSIYVMNEKENIIVGFLEIENWKPNSIFRKELNLKIPAINSKEITQEDYTYLKEESKNPTYLPELS